MNCSKEGKDSDQRNSIDNRIENATKKGTTNQNIDQEGEQGFLEPQGFQGCLQTCRSW